ncbi:LLM class flavin-dependent oxidoreductase [Demetria terragena]|uniref:LLM class flavin-dependent oxidoreductase n=1 Tax=Demetria terragena TaxID=63959 RepID=UPI00036F71B4|nr:LLM class flavin-dependent oxidoreductase [Demetria terragena]
MPQLGLILPPDQPPEQLVSLARAAEDAGVDEVWLWEDCFAPGGMTAAGAILGATDHLRVGVGLFPAPLRNVALTAMEIATLARMFPDRLLPGVGHGVQSWMAQAGAKVSSPLTLLREQSTALRRLLEGDEVSVQGRYVTLDRVQLRYPPPPTPLLIGGEGPKTLALAGVHGDGVILTGGLSLDQVRESIAIAQQARHHEGVTAPLEVVAFWAVPLPVDGEGLTRDVRALSDAGVTRVAVCGSSDDGPPEKTPAILDLADVFASQRA